MLTAIVVFFFIIIILFDYLPLRKKLSVKETVVYWAFLSVGFFVLFLYSLVIKLPSPTEPIKYVVEKFILKSGE